MSKVDFLPGMVNSYVPGSSSALSAHEQTMIARRDRLLGPAYRLFYEEPVHFVRGEGVWLYDPEGNRYLDVYNNVASVGHCQPDVVAAITKQTATLNTHT
jgi:4-aminobutyrate aminotransferase-like enzyme